MMKLVRYSSGSLLTDSLVVVDLLRELPAADRRLAVLGGTGLQVLLLEGVVRLAAGVVHGVALVAAEVLQRVSGGAGGGLGSWRVAQHLLVLVLVLLQVLLGDHLLDGGQLAVGGSH